MKILMILRLMSGFVSSIENNIWKPSGAPAIDRIIRRLDQSEQLDLIFTLKSSELDKKYGNKKLSILGLNLQPIIFLGPEIFPKIFGSLRVYLSEFYQTWKVYRYIKKTKPDLLYIDRANVLLGAFIARFTNVSVYLRLLGTPPSLQELFDKFAMSHYLYRWAYRSPFRLVLCSRDGSPGETWMHRALHPQTPRKCWVNGVDLVSNVRIPSSLIHIILIGRLNYLKRIDQAVEAILSLPAENLKKIHVDIIGEGEHYKSIKDRIEASAFSSCFTLHGAIPHKDVLHHLMEADILISLNTHGNLTNTVLEAIRCGLCLLLPEPDLKSGIDVNTYAFIPSDSLVQLRQASLLSDLSAQLKNLIDHPDLISHYQGKTREISKNIMSWEQRIDREVQLLRPYDLVLVISDLQGGGTQKVLERLLKQWVVAGKRIAIITFDAVENDAIQLPDQVDRIVLNAISKSRHALMGFVANIRRLYQLRRTIKKLRSPIVLSFLSATNVLTILATRGLQSRLIISERNDPARQSFGRIWDYLRKTCYRYADIVTANSHSAIASMASFVDRSKCYYVPNPVVLPEKIYPVTLEKLTILAVGRLHKQKAYDILINAFALFHQKHPEWQLVILGEGILRSQLELHIQSLQLEKVIELKGYVDPFPYLAAAQIYVMPSRYEGMPNALLEAMTMGLPSIISDALTGPLDFIKDRENALVVPVENIEALACAFSELANNSLLRQSLSENAKKSLSSFSLDAVLPQWEVLFDA